MDLLGPLLTMLVLLLVGAGLRSSGLLDETRTAHVNTVAYYGALPALIFVSTYERSVGDLLSPVLLGGIFAVFVATVALALVVHRRVDSTSHRSVAIVQSYHANLGYLGFPLVAAIFDADVTAIASVILGVLTLVQLPMTILILSSVTATAPDVGREIRRLLTNPVVLALIAGIGVGSSGITVAPSIGYGLGLIGSVALPLALFCVGASLTFDLPQIDVGTTAMVVAIKLGWMPVLTWLVFTALAVDPSVFTASVVMLGTPTAVSTYVFASELGGDEKFASVNVFVSTVISIVTLFLLINLVG